jgi:hypothetical protein
MSALNPINGLVAIELKDDEAEATLGAFASQVPAPTAPLGLSLVPIPELEEAARWVRTLGSRLGRASA